MVQFLKLFGISTDFLTSYDFLTVIDLWVVML